MSFWTWIAIALALISGVVAANFSRGETKSSHIISLIWFLIAVTLFFVWWFRR